MKVLNKHIHSIPENAVYIGRGSKWGNPYIIGVDGNRMLCIQKYKEYIMQKPELLACLPELLGKNLVCYCKPQPCHGDVLIDLVDDLVTCSSCGAYMLGTDASYMRGSNLEKIYICDACKVPGGSR